MILALVILGALALGLLAGAVLLLARRAGEKEVARELDAQRAGAIAREAHVELLADTSAFDLALARFELAMTRVRLAAARVSNKTDEL